MRQMGLEPEESNVYDELTARDSLTFTIPLERRIITYDRLLAAPMSLPALLLGSFSFSALGLVFGSIPTRNPGEAQMPSTLLSWGLLFISGVFIPLAEMGAAARAVAYLSSLTYAYDLLNHAVLGIGLSSPWLDLDLLLPSGLLFLLVSARMHQRSRRLGYKRGSQRTNWG